MDPGRRRIEDREAQYVAVGDVIVDELGVDWIVTFFTSRRLVMKRRDVTRRTRIEWVEPTDLFRCRVSLDRSGASGV